MGPSRSSRASAQADLLPALNPISLFHLNFRKMQVKCQKSLTVVEDYAIALEIQWTGQQDRSGVDCGNGRAGEDRVIQSLVHALNFVVKGPPGAEDIGNRRIYRWTKLAGPFTFRIGVLKDVLLDRLVLLNALQLFLAGLGVSLGDGHRNAGIFPGLDPDILGKCYFF